MRSFDVEGLVVLCDHLPDIWMLPPGHDEFSTFPELGKTRLARPGDPVPAHGTESRADGETRAGALAAPLLGPSGV
jgi:hypothetical protein